MFVTLTDSEVALCNHIGRLRSESSRNLGFTDKKIGKQSGFQTDLEGFAGELAVAKTLNLFPDLDSDDSYPADLITADGQLIDVKTTHYESGKLIAAKWKRGGGADWYVLVIGTIPRYRIAGAMRSKDLIVPERLTDLGYGQTFAAEQHELNSILTLMPINFLTTKQPRKQI
jgi:hypothetical protein